MMAPGPGSAKSRLQKVAQAQQDSKAKKVEEHKKKDINTLMSMVEGHYTNLTTEIRAILMGMAASNHSNVEIALKDPDFLHKMVNGATQMGSAVAALGSGKGKNKIEEYDKCIEDPEKETKRILENLNQDLDTSKIDSKMTSTTKETDGNENVVKIISKEGTKQDMSGIASAKKHVLAVSSTKEDIPVIALAKEDLPFPVVAPANESMPVKTSLNKYMPAMSACEVSLLKPLATSDNLLIIPTKNEMSVKIQEKIDEPKVREQKKKNGEDQNNPAKLVVDQNNEEDISESVPYPENLCHLFKKEIKLEGFYNKEIQICESKIQSNKDDISKMKFDIDQLKQSIKNKEADTIDMETKQGKLKRSWKKSRQNISKLKKKFTSLNVELPLVKIDPTETHLNLKQMDINNGEKKPPAQMNCRTVSDQPATRQDVDNAAGRITINMHEAIWRIFRTNLQ